MLPEPRRRRRNNAQIRVRRNKAPLDLLYANFHTRTARRTTISSFVVFFRFLLPLREATLFCADGPRHSASRRIHTTTTKKKKKHTLFRTKNSLMDRAWRNVGSWVWTWTNTGGLGAFSWRFSRTFGRESIHRSVFSREQQKSRFSFSLAGSALLLRLLARDGGDDGPRAKGGHRLGEATESGRNG